LTNYTLVPLPKIFSLNSNQSSPTKTNTPSKLQFKKPDLLSSKIKDSNFTSHLDKFTIKQPTKEQKTRFRHLGFVVKHLVFNIHKYLSLSFFNNGIIFQIFSCHCSYAFINKRQSLKKRKEDVLLYG